MAKVQIFEINGDKYIGTIKENVITGLVGNTSYPHYLGQKEMGNLRTIQIGNPDKLITTDFTDEQKLENKRVKSLLKLARKKTVAHVTCQIFDSLLGKR